MGIKGKKVLLIRLSALGDVVFNIPLANLLKDQGAIVHWLVSEKGFDIVNNNPCVDKAILAPVEKWKKSGNLIKNIIEYIKIIKSIRLEQYDIVIDTQLILKSFIWTVFSGGKRRIVSKSAREFSIFGGNEVIEPLFRDFKLHAVYNYYKFARYLGLDTTKINVTLPESTDEVKRRVDNILYFFNPKKLNLVIAPATTWKNKHWDIENWIELVKRLDVTKYNIIFAGTKDDKEYIDKIRGDKGFNIAGKTNLAELIELFRRTDILISLDSGSTHLAWASLKPKIISIFCSTPKERYAPLGIQHISLSGHLLCQPCHKHKCPLKTDKCTKFPDVDEVYDALVEVERSFQ